MKKYCLVAFLLLLSYSRFALECDTKDNKIIFMGDADTGKEALISYLATGMYDAASSPIKSIEKFQTADICYINTPGFDQESEVGNYAKAIQDELNQGGSYQFFFVAVLENQKPRLKDMALIDSVMNAIGAKDENKFGSNY